MRNIAISILVLAVGVVSTAGSAIVPVPDLMNSTADMPGAAGVTVTLLVVPDGSGPGFDGATDSAGNPVDGRIDLFLRDSYGDPINNFPKEDVWLEFDDSAQGVFVCFPGFPSYPYDRLIADGATDLDGLTSWALPPLAGGYNAGPVFVAINTERLLSNAGLALGFNSPDINGDKRVNIADIPWLAQDYFGEYHFRSDLTHDGAVNLADIAKFAQYFGADCP